MKRHSLIALLFFALFLTACKDTSSSDAQPPTTPEDTVATPKTPDPVQESYEGVDVSHYQNRINWHQVAASGKKFAFCKATGGITFTDPQFQNNWQQIKGAGMTRGAYHFFDPDDDAQKQADHFIATVTLESGDLPPVLDIEVEQGQSPAEIDEEITVWLKAIEAHYHVKPIIYSDYSFLKRDLPEGFCDYPLWLAEYTSKTPGGVACWDKWDFWQYSAEGKVDGISGNVDVDKYSGTDIEWKSLLVP